MLPVKSPDYKDAVPCSRDVDISESLPDWQAYLESPWLSRLLTGTKLLQHTYCVGLSVATMEGHPALPGRDVVLASIYLVCSFYQAAYRYGAENRRAEDIRRNAQDITAVPTTGTRIMRSIAYGLNPFDLG